MFCLGGIGELRTAGSRGPHVFYYPKAWKRDMCLDVLCVVCVTQSNLCVVGQMGVVVFVVYAYIPSSIIWYRILFYNSLLENTYIRASISLTHNRLNPFLLPVVPTSKDCYYKHTHSH
jgi:hypothetical protein